jgi:putative tryptophan/tyrosine transport system substrate-binding protein
MRRREFITLLGGAVAWPVATRAQQPAIPVIGFLNSGSAAEWAHLVAAFKEGLSEAGFVEGTNVAIEFRWAQGENNRLLSSATDLVRREVAVIAAFGPSAALAAKAATTTIPIVFIAGTDPIDLGLVTNFRRPTGNVTGLNVFAEVLTPKRQELLHELVPTAPLVAMLVTPTAAQTQSELRDVRAAAGARCDDTDGDPAARRRGDRVKRREFITLLGGAAAWPLATSSHLRRDTAVLYAVLCRRLRDGKPF